MQKLGQHFLMNRDILWKIADAVDAEGFDTIIEIGPGHGELTEKLRIRNKELRIIAIEKDRELVKELIGKFGDDVKIQIIEGDALKILPSMIHDSSLMIRHYAIIGNIPYYITGHLLRVVGELLHKPLQAIFLIQREVAERVCADPPRMNLLAASVQVWAEPTIIGYVSPADFSPPPKVDSAILKLEIGNKKLEDLNAYYRFIKILFKQPRKTILNNLVAGSTYQVSSMGKEGVEEILKKYKIDPKGRPQDLSVMQIQELTKAFFNGHLL